ncbi:MAG: hypothetical protein ACOZF2_05710 [Thermodesulfobacteriota bacterium]
MVINPALIGGPEGKMIYTTQKGESFDTDQDFSAAERHVLQKLILWKELAPSVEAFRHKKQEALQKGWGGSGPLPESRNLKILTRDLEEQVARRLQAEKQD